MIYLYLWIVTAAGTFTYAEPQYMGAFDSKEACQSAGEILANGRAPSRLTRADRGSFVCLSSKDGKDQK